MLFKGIPDLTDCPGNTAGIIRAVEMADYIADLLIPKGVTYLLVDARIAIYSELSAPEGDIYQHRISCRGLLHLQAREDLSRPVEGVYVPAAAFDIYPYFATCLLLGLADRGDDLLLFGRRKELLF